MPPADLRPDTSPNTSGSEAPRPDEGHNMELPTVIPVDPGPAAPTAPVAAPTPPPPEPPTAVIPLSPADTNSSTATSDLAADDRDIIEKAWIQKARTIVERTRDDPHEQNKEINKVKADYIKKRYNKDIKLNTE